MPGKSELVYLSAKREKNINKEYSIQQSCPPDEIDPQRKVDGVHHN